MSAKIEKIILKVSGKEIELSVDEAKQLKELLGEMFDKGKDNTVYIPITTPYIYRERYYPEPPYYPYVTWSCNTDGNCVTLTTTDNTLSYP